MELGDKAKGYPVGQRQDLLTLVWELSSASISICVASAFSLATNILIITGNAMPLCALYIAHRHCNLHSMADCPSINNLSA